jgi:hypothetical protein
MRASQFTRITVGVLLLASLVACAGPQSLQNSSSKRDLLSRAWVVQANSGIHGSTDIEMDFHQDGTIDLNYSGGTDASLQGSWSFLDNETKIKIDVSGGQPSSLIYTILELSPEKLRMSGGGAENVLVPK